MHNPEYQKLIKIAFLVRSLDCGGTERQLVTIVKALDKSRYDVTLFTLYAGGVFENELADTAVRYVSLEKRGRWDILRFFRTFIYQMRRLRPDLIYGALDLSNLLALSAKLFLPQASIIWSTWTSDINLRHYDWLRRAAPHLERLFSRFPDCIIANSYAGRSHLLKQGVAAKKLVVIQSGIDTDYFRPDREAGERIRHDWSIPESAILIGLVGRLDPVKDHPTFLRAAALLHKERPDVRFVCIGGGAESYSKNLRSLAESLSISTKIYWAGMRSDMRSAYNALDINVSSSLSEGFPNAVCEAMACGVPCVVTDAGDSALIVGDSGFVSNRRDPKALATSLISCLDSDRVSLGRKARLRIKENWSVERLAQRTESVIIAL